MNEEIILIKLTNDEQLIGILKEEDENGFELENPFRVEIAPRNNVKPVVFILPWNELSKMESVYIDKFHVLYCTSPKDDIVKFYKNQVKNFYEEETAENIESFDALIEKIASNTSVH